MKPCTVLSLASQKVVTILSSVFGSLFLSSMRKGYLFLSGSAICVLFESVPFINNFSIPGHKVRVKINLTLE